MRDIFLEIESILESLFTQDLKNSSISAKFSKMNETKELNCHEDLPYRYTILAQKYYSAYFQSSSTTSEDFILEFFQENKSIGLVPISISHDGRSVTSNGEPLLFPFFTENISASIHDALDNLFLELVWEICKHFELALPVIQEYSVAISSRMCERLLLMGAVISTREVYIKNCQGTQRDLWSGIRKSYKPLINRGLKNLEYGIATGKESLSLFEQFRGLHKLVAGRTTRSDETWALQGRELLSETAFLTYVVLNHELVGGSYIPHNNNNSLYAVGVYRRDLVELNLGHISQWLAIENLNKLGISIYRLGHLDIGQKSEATLKEQSIAHFKRGFASEVQTEHVFSFGDTLNAF